jgi:hypothetical protein
MGWAAQTNSWTLDIGTSIWLVGDDGASHPPAGYDLPILLIDGAIVSAIVLNASSSEITLKLFDFMWRLTPAAAGRTSSFPGAEWILSSPTVLRVH